jgi:hypothetical protein
MPSARRHKRQQTLHIVAPKPRNPLVAPAQRRKAGEHRKSGKAERALQKVRLRYQISSEP